MSDLQWHFQKDGKPAGPASTDMMKSLIRQGAIKAGHLVWSADMPAWAPVEATVLRDELAELPPPPMPAVHMNNMLAWVMAFFPLLLILSVVALEQAIGKKIPTAPGYSLAVAAVLTVVFLVDRSWVRKASGERGAFPYWPLVMFFLAFLTPGYLYSRARLLRQKLWYFWAAIISYGLILLGIFGAFMPAA